MEDFSASGLDVGKVGEQIHWNGLRNDHGRRVELESGLNALEEAITLVGIRARARIEDDE